MSEIPIRVFIAYSHKDERLRRELEEHLALLRLQGLIAVWDDRDIVPGVELTKEISTQLEAADLVLLLVSASFLASEYCYSIEMSEALERHNAGSARVVPIVVRPCLWAHAPFSKLQLLPRNGRPVTKWRNRDEAWIDVAAGLRRW